VYYHFSDTNKFPPWYFILAEQCEVVGKLYWWELVSRMLRDMFCNDWNQKKKRTRERLLYALRNKLIIMWQNTNGYIYRIYICVIKSIKHVIITYYYFIIAFIYFAYPFYAFCWACLECIVWNCFNDSKICHMNAKYTCIRAEYISWINA